MRLTMLITADMSIGLRDLIVVWLVEMAEVIDRIGREMGIGPFHSLSIYLIRAP